MPKTGTTRQILTVLFVVGQMASASGAPAQSCAKPPPPTIPNGAATTDAEMSRTLQEMRAYETAINQYLDCAYSEYSNAKAEGEATLKRWNDATEAFRLNN